MDDEFWKLCTENQTYVQESDLNPHKEENSKEDHHLVLKFSSCWV